MKREPTYLESEILYQVMELLYREIDELIHELAPEGWNNSPYHFPFELIEGEREALYKTYDTVACAYERRFGPIMRQYISKSRYEIDYMTRTGSNHNYAAELVYLIEHGVIQLSGSGLFFKRNEATLEYIIEPFDVEEQSYVLGMDLDLANAVDPCMLRITAARSDVLLYIDLSAIYARILQAFGALGYDWRYRDVELEDLWIQSELVVRFSNLKSRHSHDSYLDILSEVLAERQNELPPDEVIGYLSVYEKLPVGYPPTLEDLQRISLGLDNPP
ncbi:hypothetical protein [Sphingobacterium tabacisoli]|uniref:Uncharacterized protein n=1 Tax=Sphingobacterium tabacisoli TaxID=2044855 RepID=A0ABW5L0L4_9SPHI|nr:hypothetical protein [Sphingobacterium tabacisoli]